LPADSSSARSRLPSNWKSASPTKIMERTAGIEPATYSLGSCRSTTELRPRSVSPKPQDNATARLGKAPRVLPLPRTCLTLWAKEDLTHDRAHAGGGKELGGAFSRQSALDQCHADRQGHGNLRGRCHGRGRSHRPPSRGRAGGSRPRSVWREEWAAMADRVLSGRKPTFEVERGAPK